MKDFEYFVNLVFCGNTKLDEKPYMPGINSDTIMAIGSYADAGLFDDLIDHFKDAAHQWRDQFLDTWDGPDPLMVNEGENRYEKTSM